MKRSDWSLSTSSLAHYCRFYIHMKKYGYLLLFLTTAFACQNTSNDKQQQVEIPEQQDSIGEHIQTDSLSASPKEIITTAEVDSIIDGRILMPTTYRVWENEVVSKVINKNWFELHHKNGSYHVQSVSYHIENEDEEPCSGLPTETIVPKEDVLVFFDIPSIQKGAVDSVAFKNKIIEPGKPFEFTYKNQKYKLQATGILFHKDQERNNPNARYTLKLYKDGTYLRTIIDQTAYNDTSTELEFIGDLDKDGLPDFIFSSPRDYEERRMIIILSASPYAYDGNVQFDC